MKLKKTTGNQKNVLQQLIKLSELKTDSPNKIIQSGLKLHRLATTAAIGHFGDFLSQNLGPKKIIKLQGFSLLFEITLDNVFMNGVLSGTFTDPDQHPLQSVYNLLAKREYDMVMNQGQIDTSESWMHIGSGYPETAIGLFRQFGIPIICVDKDASVVSKIEPVLKKFNLWGKDKLTAVNANGRNILPEAKAIIISAMVPNEDKKAIIQNIGQLPLGKRIKPLLILRTPANPAFAVLYPTLFNENKITALKLRKIDDSKSRLTDREWLRSMLFEVI